MAQFDPRWEAIIVDDGDDGTRDIVSAFKDERFKYFKLNMAHGCGASCARNFAALMASAEIIAILDSDDIAKL